MADIMRQQPWIPLDEVKKKEVDTIKGMGNELHDYLDTLEPSREMSLAKTKLEEAVMWAVKGVTG